jgi:hypothetical protein
MGLKLSIGAFSRLQVCSIQISQPRERRSFFLSFGEAEFTFFRILAVPAVQPSPRAEGDISVKIQEFL